MPKSESKKLGAPTGHEGSTREQPKPDKVVNVTAKKCSNCGCKLGSPSFVERRVIEEIPKPQPINVTQYNLPHYNCSNCGSETIASHPDCPLEGRFGYNLLSEVALSKFEDRLPYRKIGHSLKRRFGLTITPSTIFDVTNRVSNHLKDDYKKLVTRIRLSQIVNIDETSIRVNGKKFWIWIFKSRLCTLIVIRYSRGENVLREVLGDNFRGTIICDGWKPYFKFHKNIQRCWAHLLREAKYISIALKDAIPFYKSLARMFKKLTRALEGNPPERVRNRLYLNAKRTLYNWLSKDYSEMRINKFIKKVKTGLPYWFTFVLKPNVEPTNNAAERGLREHVVIRKIIGTLRNTKGTQIQETLMSLFATWKQAGLDLRTQTINALRS
ncbi:MAG: IS66 family transposase [Acidobacteriota bacterium]